MDARVSAVRVRMGLASGIPTRAARAKVDADASAGARPAGRPIRRLPWVDYSPGTMRCAVVVPGFMIHAPPWVALSGRPVVAVVAPGRATVMC